MTEVQTTRIDCFLECAVEVQTAQEEDPGFLTLRIVDSLAMRETLLCRHEVEDLITALQKHLQRHLGRVSS